MNRYPNESPAWLVVAAGLFVLLLLAAPRSAATVIPATDSASAEPKVSVSGNLAPSGAPLPAIPLPTQDPGELTSSAFGGTATWCAPTPKYCQNWGRPKLLGAMESFSYGDKPYLVTVWHGKKHVTVTVVSYCDCGSTLIDLSVAAFEKLAPLSRGRIDVTIEGFALPATETEALP